jgi:thiol-disulfide isomerase/thioredoxin
MPTRRLTAAAAATVAAAALLLSGCASTSSAATSGPDGGFVAGDGSIVVVPAASRSAAPEVSGGTLDGTTFRLSDHLGEVVVLNVWASWCAPCRAEAPGLAALANEYAGKGVQFAGLDTRDSDVSARAFVEKFDTPYPNVIDRDGRLQLLFGDSLPPQAIPSTLVIDRDGKVAARALGKVSESSLRAMIDPLLAPGE